MRSGFTLLEILVATIISAFVALTAAAALQAVISSRNKIDTNIHSAAELNFAVNMISDDLRNLARKTTDDDCPIVGTLMPLQDTIATNLTIQTINRIKARPDQVEGDLYEIEYYLAINEDRPQLMRRVWPHPNREHEPGGILTCIAENIVNFSVGYYDGDTWHSEWPEDMTDLPHLVEFTLAARIPDHKQSIRRSVLINFPRRPNRVIEPSIDLDAAGPTDDRESEPDEEER